MSRRSNVVRSQTTGGETTSRGLTVGATIYCAQAPCLQLAPADSWIDMMSVPVMSAANFQRIFVAVTITEISAFVADGDNDPLPSTIAIDLVAQAPQGWTNNFGHTTGGGFVPPNGWAPSAAITGAADLVQGTNHIILRVAASVFGGYAEIGGASMQIIMGQVVDTAQCGFTGSPS